MAEIDKEEKRAIKQYGPPVSCPKCGHDVFRTGWFEMADVKVFRDGGCFVHHVVTPRGGDSPSDLICRNCDTNYDLGDFELEEEEEEE